jgi:hypothetical protein
VYGAAVILFLGGAFRAVERPRVETNKRSQCNGIAVTPSGRGLLVTNTFNPEYDDSDSDAGGDEFGDFDGPVHEYTIPGRCGQHPTASCM